MAPIVTWISLITGIICTGGAIAVSSIARGEEATPIDPPLRRSLVIASVFTTLIAVLMFLVTLPYVPPFASGQRLGWGFLIGGLISAAAGPILVSMFHRALYSDSPWASYSAGIAAASTALFAVSLVLLIFRGYPQPALMGLSMAAIMAAVFIRLGLSRLSDDADSDTALMGVEVYTVAVVTLTASVTLSVQRFWGLSGRDWWPSALLIFATVCLASFAAASIGTIRKVAEKPGRSYSAATAITAVVTLGLLALYVLKIYPDWQLLYAAAVGVVAAVITAWLIASISKERTDAGSDRLESAVMIVLVLVGAGMISFRFLGGYGIGLSLIGAWTLAIPAYGLIRKAGESRSLIPVGLHLLLSTGLAMLLFRLFVASYPRELRELDLRAYYSFSGVLLGAIAPFAAAIFLMRLRPASKGTISRLAAMGLMGLLSAVSPLVVLVIWGLRAELGFAAGLAAAQVFLLLMFLLGASGLPGWGKDPVTSMQSNILSIAMLVSAVYFTGPLMPLLDMTRTQKAYILAGAVGVGVLLVIASWFIGRLERRGRSDA